LSASSQASVLSVREENRFDSDLILEKGPEILISILKIIAALLGTFSAFFKIC